MQISNNLSLRRKQMLILMATSSAALILACAAISLYEVFAFRDTMRQDISTLADIVDHNTVAALDFDDPLAATETLSALQADPSIIGAWLYKPDGQVFAKYDRPNDNITFAPPALHPNGTVFQGRRLIVCRPVVHKGETIGTLYLETDMQALYTRLTRYAWIVGLVFAVSSLIVFGLSSQLQRVVSDPVLHLAQVAQTVARDKNYSLRAKKQSNDEIGQLVDGFNEMLEEIQRRDAALEAARDDLEHRVVERTKELAESRLLYHSLVDQMPAGVFRKDGTGRYVFVNSWYCRIKGMAADQILGKTPNELAAGELKGQKMEPAETARVNQLAGQGANHHELIMATGKRIEVEEDYPGVAGRMEHLHVVKLPVFGPEGKIIGTQGMLFDVTERKQAEAELSYERDLLRALLDNSPDQIYFKDAQSRFLKSSKAQAENFGVKQADDLIGKTDFDFFAEAHARTAFEDEQEIIRTGRPLLGKIEKEVWPDGRTSWVIANKMPLRNQDGKIIGTFGLSKDITAIKQAEAKLEQVHQQLLETSRQAGMAEVATNVLHNVGNVLNSVNVSASLVVDAVKKSKAVNLAQVAAMLRDHAHDLAAFFSSDAKGKQLPAYLSRLSEHLLADQKTTIEELELLLKNIDHIKDIVTTQQSYARVSGVREIINLAELVEDCLRMNAGGLGRHGVELIREFEAVPPINIDRHKVLQVLVNLIRNAKHACQDAERADKRLTVRLAPGDGSIKISVTDNGVGILPENLLRIFNHGFTTRKNGHGFGLHSGALAAKEMHGSLNAQSAGLGRGATFTLELPCNPNEATHE